MFYLKPKTSNVTNVTIISELTPVVDRESGYGGCKQPLRLKDFNKK